MSQRDRAEAEALVIALEQARLALEEQRARTEKAQSEARVALMIEQIVREQKAAVELPKVKLGGAS